MSPRALHPRTSHQHELLAADVLGRYQRVSGWQPCLPVPIDDLVERLFDLRIVWQTIPEPAGQTILGALDPESRVVTLNESHFELFEQVVGPERFTLAHELGHWLYDAEDPDQQALFSEDHGERYCRDVSSRDISAAERLRERNADRFAARLLLPADLVRASLPPGRPSAWPVAQLARDWGVSRRTLEIRLEELRLL